MGVIHAPPSSVSLPHTWYITSPSAETRLSDCPAQGETRVAGPIAASCPPILPNSAAAAPHPKNGIMLAALSPAQAASFSERQTSASTPSATSPTPGTSPRTVSSPADGARRLFSSRAVGVRRLTSRSPDHSHITRSMTFMRLGMNHGAGETRDARTEGLPAAAKRARAAAPAPSAGRPAGYGTQLEWSSSLELLAGSVIDRSPGLPCFRGARARRLDSL
jgi:hypothetical protein